MKIVISGTYSTGKTTTSLALSQLTNIPVTHARTMREILPVTFPGKRLEECDFHELVELGIRRFTERVIVERKIGDSFISDGCPLQEWIYGQTRNLTGLNPSEKQWKIKLHQLIYSSKWDVFEKAINSFGDAVKKYTKHAYSHIIHLPPEIPFEPDGHRPVSELFRAKSEELLLNTYRELGLKVLETNGTLEHRLTQIINYLSLDTVMSVDEAIQKAHRIRKIRFDQIKMERSSSAYMKSKIII